MAWGPVGMGTGGILVGGGWRGRILKEMTGKRVLSGSGDTRETLVNL